MSIQERILQYLDYKIITPYKFCKDLKFSMGYLDKRGAIGTDKYLKIIEYYKDINPEWLLTGKGDMLKSHNDKKLYKFEEPQVEYSAEKNKDTEIISILKDTIHALKESLELKDYKINKLEQENEALKKEINSLNIVKDITVAKPLETISKINK